MHSDEITILDVAVFLAERWLILVLVPTFAAIGVFLLAPEPPATYVATATMILPSNSTAENADSLPRWSRGFSLALSQAQEDVSTTAMGDRVVLRAERSSEDDAEAAVLSSYSALSEPVIETLSDELARLENLLLAMSAGISLPIEDTDSIATIAAKAQVQSALFPLDEQAWLIRGMIADLQIAPAVTTSRLSVFGSEFYAAVAAICAFFLTLAVALLRTAMKTATSDPDSSEKLARISAAFRLRRHPARR